jgi:hypothetical protein
LFARIYLRSLLALLLALSFANASLSGHASVESKRAMHGIALADNLRVQRPADGFVQSVFQCDYSPLDDFNHWRQEYAEPTLCPMVLCRGMCSYRESRCTVTADGGVSQCPSAWMSDSMYENGLSGCESSQ